MEGGACTDGNGGGGGEIMLFGVRVVVDSLRKSVSLNNLSQYEQPSDLNTTNTNNTNDNNSDDNNNNENISVKEGFKGGDVAGSGYTSADDAVPRSSARGERKRGVPWTEEEHKLFLLGLQKVGKGDWRGISRNFVKTRTPTQVASHAQKYFLRRSNLSRRRRRSSLFDITTDSVSAIPMEAEQDKAMCSSKGHPSALPLPSPPQETRLINNLPVMANFPMTSVSPVALPITIENLHGNQSINPTGNVSHPMPFVQTPRAATMSDLNLSLKLSLTSGERELSTSRHPEFEVMPSFSNGDSIISVA